MRLSDKAVLDERLVIENVSISPEELAAPKTAATANALTAKPDAALDLCAARIANYWTVPAIGAKDKQNASETASEDGASQGKDDAIPGGSASKATPATTKRGDQNSASAAPASSGPRAAAPDPASIEQVRWDAVKNSQSGAELPAYPAQYPHGRFATLARARLAALQPAAATPVRPAAAAPELVGTLVITHGVTKIEKLSASRSQRRTRRRRSTRRATSST